MKKIFKQSQKWFQWLLFSHVESFLYPDKQGTAEEGRRIQWSKHCVSTDSNKDEDNSPKNITNKIYIYINIYMSYIYINIYMSSYEFFK